NVNLHPDTDEGRRLRGLIIRSGLQRSHVTRNSTIACVETDTRIRMSRPSQPTSRPILRNRDGTRAIDSTAGNVYTNLNHILILLGTTDTKTIDIITIPENWHVPRDTTTLRFSVTGTFLVDPTFRLQHIIIQITKHHRRPTPIHVEPSNLWTTIDLIIQFINFASAKHDRPPSLLIELPELEF
ncbi:MAG: hypothetical protein EZS28_054963, partial [Streblomastix strix]